MSKNLKERRWHKASLVSWFLQIVPFIRFIGITGSMAHGVIKPSSDIDIFVISGEKRLWTCRYVLETLLRIIGQLRTGNLPRQRAGKICPNRYVTDQYLIINPQNKYHSQDYIQMVPLYNIDNNYKKFITANTWMEKFGYFEPRKVLNLVHSNTLGFIRKCLEYLLKGSFGNKIEAYFKKRQIADLKKQHPNLNCEGSAIVVNDNEIRIHDKPR